MFRPNLGRGPRAMGGGVQGGMMSPQQMMMMRQQAAMGGGAPGVGNPTAGRPQMMPGGVQTPALRQGIMPPGGQVPAPAAAGLKMAAQASQQGQPMGAGNTTTPNALTPQAMGQVPNLGNIQDRMNDPAERAKFMQMLGAQSAGAQGGGAGGLLGNMDAQALMQGGLGLLNMGYGG